MIVMVMMVVVPAPIMTAVIILVLMATAPMIITGKRLVDRGQTDDSRCDGGEGKCLFHFSHIRSTASGKDDAGPASGRDYGIGAA
jgi:hypothetical protein